MRSKFAVKLLFALIIPAFLVAALFSGCTEKDGEAAKTAEVRLTPVITGKTEPKTVRDTLSNVGTLKASREVSVRAEIEGKVIAILFEEGKSVEKGQILVKLDAAKTEAEIRNVEARIRQLQIRLTNKERTLERNRPLVERNVVSQQHYDDLKAEVEEIKAEIAQAQADLSRQKERLADTIIRAPFDGVAGAREISPGDYLKTGDPVLSVVDLDPLEISFQVPERFKPRLSVGQGVSLKVDAYPGRVFKGEISFIAPRVNLDTRTFQVKAEVRNKPPLLNPGMFARVDVTTGVRENALAVPWESIIQTENETYLYILDEEKIARKVSVRLGQVTPEWAEVLHPELPAGKPVVTEGKYAVKDGMKVEVQKAVAERSKDQ